MNQSTSSHKPTRNLSDCQIAFIRAGWHSDIVDQSRLGFIDTIGSAGLSQANVSVFDVPGSLEIPLQCKLLAKSGDYSLIVAAGLIVDGGIYRHDFVAATVLDGMMQVQLDCEIPILSIVLTPHHFSGEAIHHEFFYDHFKVKGAEAGNACIQMLESGLVRVCREAA